MFEHRLQHGFLVSEVVGFGEVLSFLVQAIEVGGGDLQGVELKGGTRAWSSSARVTWKRPSWRRRTA
ncbi:MAG: hypothetical protein LAN64_17765 [Acidobacteriia bacterium]|nr:hypothetical protein [Terriglobia bacterium]